MTIKASSQAEELEKLNVYIQEKFDAYFSQPKILKFLAEKAETDKRPYAIYLTQVYHYTSHTARNQALVGVNLSNRNIRYMKFCFKHALEETGHELMAIHDLKAMGMVINNMEQDMPPMLPATELLISYLYWVSTQGNPMQRLGYSYWAERSYSYIGNIVESMAESLNLDNKQMTFYFNHAVIDEKHAEEVEKILLSLCETKEDWDAIRRVAGITVDLSLDIISQCIASYIDLSSGEDSAFDILNSIQKEGVN